VGTERDAMTVSSPVLQELSASEAPVLRRLVPGPRPEAIPERERRWLSPGGSAAASLSSLVLAEGHGALVSHVNSNVFIGFCSGTVAVNAGHCPPEVVPALHVQARQLTHSYDFSAEVRADCPDYLASVLPPELRMFHISNSGAEAVEAATKPAKSYTGEVRNCLFLPGIPREDPFGDVTHECELEAGVGAVRGRAPAQS
jgi:4-aminobutyrate aminotransferase-like enzyme